MHAIGKMLTRRHTRTKRAYIGTPTKHVLYRQSIHTYIPTILVLSIAIDPTLTTTLAHTTRPPQVPKQKPQLPLPPGSGMCPDLLLSHPH